MNDREMAPTPRHLPVRSRFDGRRARNSPALSGAAYAIDPIRSYDGTARVSSEARGQGCQVMRDWFKERPYLLLYIALVVTIELIVEIF